MSFVISIKNLRPSGRQDNILWTAATIEQSADADGVPTGGFSTVETFPITTYPDPTEPPTLALTTDQATAIPGWYRVKFTDPGPGIEYTAPLFFDVNRYRPSTKRVASYIDNRTVDTNNNYQHDFTDTTIVTKDTVEELISTSEEYVLRKLDQDPNVVIPVESQQAVSNLIALYAAMLVELTKFSEQIQANRSPYPFLKQLFDEQWPTVVEDVTGIAPDTGTGGTSATNVWDLVASGSQTVSFAFPTPDLVNWDTKF